LYYKSLENALEKYKQKPDEFKKIFPKFNKLIKRALELATTPEQYRRVQTGISNTADNIFFKSDVPGEILGELPDRLQYPLYKGPIPPQNTFNKAELMKFAKDNNITLPEYVPVTSSFGHMYKPATPRTLKKSKDIGYPVQIKLFLEKWFKTQAQQTYMDAYPDKAEAYKKQLEFTKLTKDVKELVNAVMKKTKDLDNDLVYHSKEDEPSDDDINDMINTIESIVSNLTLIDVILIDWTKKSKISYPGIPQKDDLVNRIEKLKDLLVKFRTYRHKKPRNTVFFDEFVIGIPKTKMIL
jgi:hypothetical protein